MRFRFVKLLFLLEAGERAFQEYKNSGRTYSASLTIFRINLLIQDSLLQVIDNESFEEEDRKVLTDLFLHITGWIEQYKFEKEKRIGIKENDIFAWDRWSSTPPFPDISSLKR